MSKTLSTKDHNYYGRALKLSLYGEHRVRVGALASVNAKITAGAFNTYRNVVNNAPYGSATYHAEFNCVRQIPPRLLPRTTLYVARVDKIGNPMDSRPCARCIKLLTFSGVRDVVYYFNGQLLKERLWNPTL